jgi:hypothetical protein
LKEENMPKYDTQLAALEAVLEEDRCFRTLLDQLDSDELAQLGQAAQDLAQQCENAWFIRLAEQSEAIAQLLGPQGRW